MSERGTVETLRRGAVTILGVVTVFFVLFLTWIFTVPGRNQAITESAIQARLWKGASMSEAMYALGLSQSDLETTKTADGLTFIAISRHGLIGPYLMPQREITLTFDDRDRLIDAFCNTVFVCEEQGASLQLAAADPSPRR